ncbi:MAG: autotransporter assembly complex protein TamA [Gammaproteobacteria bacterium]
MPQAIQRRLATRPVEACRQRIIITMLVALACLWPWTAQSQIRVSISGVEPEIEANIRATLNLVRLGTREDLSEAAVRRLHSRARGEIRDAMRPFGYYRPRMETSLERQDGDWLASFQIDPGEAVLVTEIDVRILGEGSDDARLLDVVAQSPLRRDRRLRHQEHDRLRSNLQGVAAQRGYFEAEFTQRRLEVEPSELSARIILHLETGPRYHLGAIDIEQDILNEDLLQRIVLLREGDPYSGDAVLQTQYRLTDSAYFSSVIVQTGTPDATTRAVPISIETVPTRRQRIRTGIGYATDTRLRGSLGVDWRRLNKAGHSAGTELRLAETSSELSGRYRIPIGDPIKERLLFRGGVTYEDLADVESRRATLGVSHVTQRGGGWQRTLFTDLIEERTRAGDEPAMRDLLVVPGIGMEKLIADDILFPRHGYRLRGEIRGSHQLLGASTDFLRLEAEANHVSSLGEDWRFFARSRLGIGFVDGFSTLPASQRFFAGGDQSVRGYRFNSMGPRDEAGNIIGGKHLVFGSLEAERRVWGRVALAGFVDAGNALDDFGDPIEVAVGLGVHVHTPIGTVRIAIAQSVTESRNLRLHLTIRPDL